MEVCAIMNNVIIASERWKGLFTVRKAEWACGAFEVLHVSSTRLAIFGGRLKCVGDATPPHLREPTKMCYRNALESTMTCGRGFSVLLLSDCCAANFSRYAYICFQTTALVRLKLLACRLFPVSPVLSYKHLHFT
jgi:hypothetical protein